MQLAQVMFPRIERLKAEGQSGRKKINQYTRYLDWYCTHSVFHHLHFLREYDHLKWYTIVLDGGGWWFTLVAVITMTSGSCFVMWLGGQLQKEVSVKELLSSSLLVSSQQSQQVQCDV